MSKLKSLHADREAGFTLIEIMIAITVFAIGLLAINVMQTTSISGNSAANWNALRTNLASDQIESFMVRTYTELQTAIAATPTIITTDPSTGDTRATTTRTFQQNFPATDLATITVTIVDAADTASPPARPTIFTYIKSTID